MLPGGRLAVYSVLHHFPEERPVGFLQRVGGLEVVAGVRLSSEVSISRLTVRHLYRWEVGSITSRCLKARGTLHLYGKNDKTPYTVQ